MSEPVRPYELLIAEARAEFQQWEQSQEKRLPGGGRTRRVRPIAVGSKVHPKPKEQKP